MTPAGFPHSDIPGSKPVCGSPRLIAAYHVLRRLLVPRHPPCALSSLTGISKVHSLCYPASRIRLSKSDRSAFALRESRPPAVAGTYGRDIKIYRVLIAQGDPNPLSNLVEIA